MKKILLVVLLVFGFSLFSLIAGAEKVFYTAGDFEISLSDMTAMTAYDFLNKDIKFGAFTSIVKWKFLCGDLGIIKGDEEDENIAPMGGVSVDSQKLFEELGGEWKLPKTINVGAFGARDWDRDKWMAGCYAGLKFEF